MALTKPHFLVEDLIDELRPDRSSESRLEKLAVAKRQAMTRPTKPAPGNSRDLKPQWLDMSRHPSMGDVMLLKGFLAQTLPTEIVDLIISFIEYWPHTTSILDNPFMSFGKRLFSDVEITARNVRENARMRQSPSFFYEDTIADDFLLRSPPLGVCSVKVAVSLAHAGFLSRPHVLGIRGLKGVRFSPPFVRLPNAKDWDCPRGRYPARVVILESLSRVEARNPYEQPVLWCDVHAKNLLIPEKLLEVKPNRTVRTEFLTNFPNGQFHHHSTTLRFDDDDGRHLIGVVSPLGAGSGVTRDGYRRKPDKQVSIVKRQASANFVRDLREGDSIGIWARGVPGEYMNMFEEVRLHVFWAV